MVDVSKIETLRSFLGWPFGILYASILTLATTGQTMGSWRQMVGRFVATTGRTRFWFMVGAACLFVIFGGAALTGIRYGVGLPKAVSYAAENHDELAAIGVDHVIDPPSGLRVTQTFRDCSQCPEMVVLSGGEFTMGSSMSEKSRDESEGPLRRVRVQPFAASKFDVTFDEWAACVTGGGCQSNPNPNDLGNGRGAHPVINVSWNDAQEYADWLSRRAGYGYRLLSEAEWEYAARAGTTTAYFFGSNITPDQAQYAWQYADAAELRRPSGAKGTAQVGSFLPNAFGLYDMHGNAWQWVQDCWSANYHDAPTDGIAWTNGDCEHRVLRGGSWIGIKELVRSAFRHRSNRGSRGFDYGFRVGRPLYP
jgi:formylglycine-generating enzyme required for sulfatase activity